MICTETKNNSILIQNIFTPSMEDFMVELFITGNGRASFEDLAALIAHISWENETLTTAIFSGLDRLMRRREISFA